MDSAQRIFLQYLAGGLHQPSNHGFLRLSIRSCLAAYSLHRTDRHWPCPALRDAKHFMIRCCSRQQLDVLSSLVLAIGGDGCRISAEECDHHSFRPMRFTLGAYHPCITTNSAQSCSCTIILLNLSLTPLNQSEQHSASSAPIR